MLLDRHNLPSHKPWIALAIVVSVASVLACLWESWRLGHWPGGGSRVGLATGIVAGLIIVFELLLWPRKRLRAVRIGSAQAWLRAHLWLGLLTVPLVVVHSGGRLGSSLNSALVLVFVIVIASGIWGLALQQVLPKLMLERVAAETIVGEIDHIAMQNYEDAVRLVERACGPIRALGSGDFDRRDLSGDARPMTIGVFRTVGKTSGKVLQTKALSGEAPRCEALHIAFEEQIGPFLREGKQSRCAQLSDAAKSSQLFVELKARANQGAQEVIDQLQALVDQRRQFDLQIVIHRWLHGWLLIHAPLSVLLLVLLLVHAYAALKY